MKLFEQGQWSPGYFKGAPGKLLRAQQDAEFWLSVQQHLTQCLAPVSAWQRVPIVARLRLTSTADNAKGFAARPGVLVGSAWGEDLASSFLFADLSGSRGTLTIVLYDWSELKLDRTALGELGCPVDQLHDRLEAAGSKPVAEGGTHRWCVSADGNTLTLASGDLWRDDVEPRVGRFGLGSLAWGQASVGLELLALPRLHRSHVVRTTDHPVALDGDLPAWRGCLDRTFWRVGAANSLVAWLNLSRGEQVLGTHEIVHVTATENASPLAWLPLVRALEDAALAQRRQYQRTQRVVRAPTGTLRVGAYLGYLARQRADLVPVDRFELTADTPENRLFKGAASRVRRVLATDGGALAANLRRRFERVEGQFIRAADVEPSLSLVRGVAVRPLPPLQQRAVELCDAMLQGRYPGLEIQGRSFAQMEGFELNIAQLFEAAAREVLRRCCARSIGAVVEDGNLIATGKGEAKQSQLYWMDKGVVGGLDRSNVRVNLLPDFMVLRSKQVIAIGDAKYKRLQRRNTPAGSSHAPLRREDLHQLETYLAAWPTTRWGVVIYPHTALRSETDPPADAPATRLVSELHIGGDRRLGIFDLAAEHWNDRRVGSEELTRWIADQV